MDEDISYDSIQELLDRILGSSSFDFGEYVAQLVNGDTSIDFVQFLGYVGQGLLQGLKEQKNLFVLLIILAVFCGLFTNFARMFQGKQVADTAFYVTYVLLFSSLAASFYRIQDVASTAVESLLEYMKVFVPSYFIAMSFSNGAQCSSAYYQFTLVVIAGLQYLLVYLLLPCVRIYFLLVLANHLSEEDFLSKAQELVATFVRWSTKTMTAVVIGMNVIQSMILPVTGQIRKSAALKATSFIPGIGGGANAVAETVLSAALVVKNAVGAVGVFGIVVICAIPLARLIVYSLAYQCMGAVLQPVSDKRIVGTISGVAMSIRLLLYLVGVGALMFILSITVMTSLGNVI